MDQAINTQAPPVYLHKPALVCALGANTEQVAQALFATEQKPLKVTGDYSNQQVAFPLGLMSCLDERALDDGQPEQLPPHQDSRNNRLLLLALQQLQPQLNELLKRHASHRIAVVLGTSTSGIAEAEKAYQHRNANGQLPSDYAYPVQEFGAPAEFIAQRLRLCGPTLTISTACSSGAKALASARRLLQSHLADAVICGGADSLCRLTVNGFDSLESVSSAPCNPSSVNRNGINIGEAAALFIMTREPAEQGPQIQLSGVGETSDAYHISAPHPEGVGALAAITEALQDADLQPQQIDYVNLHGTATPHNDRMEHLAVNKLLGNEVACSSTKPLTGHTLGASGALEAGFCWLTLAQQTQLPPHWFDGDIDPELAPLKLVSAGQKPQQAPQHVLSNSFAFGGNNIALILSLRGAV